MKPLALFVLVGVTILVPGCDASAPHPGPSPIEAADHGSPGRQSPIPSPGSRELAPLVLTVDLDEKPVNWKRVLFIPFGNAEDQLLYLPAHEIPTREPTSFSVAPDGSFWILDVAKHRLTHFSRDGRLVTQRGGYTAYSRDLAFFEGDLYTFEHYQFGRILRIHADGPVDRIKLEYQGQSVYMSELIPDPSGLTIRIPGYTLDPASGPNGFYRFPLQPGTQEISELPGIPLGTDRWFQLTAPGDQDLVANFIDSSGSTEQPIRVQIKDGKRTLSGLVGAGKYVVAGQDVAMYVKVVAYRPGGGQVGRRYLLRVGASPLLWERLPDPNGIDDDTQWRYLTVGPDGHLYLMVTDHDGIRIYRRPS